METKPNDPVYPDRKLNAVSKNGLGIVIQYELQNIGGLTKREQFAMAAMQGMIGSMMYSGWTYIDICDSAVRAADRLIESLNKEV